jgi:phosphate transport system permease protein
MSRSIPRLSPAPKAIRWSWTFLLSTGFSLAALVFFVAMGAAFLWQSLPVWQDHGLRYITGTEWFFRQRAFGALPMIYGTLVVSLLALALAAPLAIGAALCSSEVLSGRPRLLVKMLIELLAGVPSVIYGLLGILFLRQWVYDVFEPFDPLSGDTLLTAGLLLSVMVLPTIMTLADDALRSVPSSQRQAARGLGLTRAETILFVTLPQAWRGIVSAVLLGLGRAMGEGIAVFMVIGRQDNQWPENLFSLRPLLEAGQTLNSKLVGSETNIAYGDPLNWAAMTGLGLLLMGTVIAVTGFGVWITQQKGDDAARS